MYSMEGNKLNVKYIFVKRFDFFTTLEILIFIFAFQQRSWGYKIV